MLEKYVDTAADGLRFHVLNTDRFKMSRLSFNFILPADRVNSPKTKLMLAVMMRGSNNYPTISHINRRLDELYGATVTWRALRIGGRHIFKISCEILSNRYRLRGDDTDILKGVTEVILDILFSPQKDDKSLLLQSYIDSEKKIAIDAIRAKINDQKAYAAERCAKIMLRDDASGISTDGDEEMIRGFTAEELTDNISDFLSRAALECYYVGSDDPTECISLVKNAFSGISRIVCPIGRESAFLPSSLENTASVEEIMPVSQGRLVVGCAASTVMSDRDYHAMSLFNEVFGGSSTAKLFMNVREKKSLCYYCYSSYNSANGAIMISCGIMPENLEAALSEIRAQLDAMRSGEVSDEEILTAKRATVSGLRQMNDNPSALEAFEFRRYLAGVSESSEECAASIESITREDIISAASKVRFDTVYFLRGEPNSACTEDEDDE